ncbi:MAG: DNA repair protein RadC [Candidatus Pacebacteria bacterium]|nr:DNA repair protein RadC [Candidatus Paceibacterota bacterium]
METHARYAMSLSPMILNESDIQVSGKRYTLRVRDLPSEEKPRERLLSSGPGVLSTAELLAIVLSTGTKKEEVLTMTNRIMREYGDRNVLFSTDPKTLALDLDLPLGKAMQIVACGELGRRYFRRNKDGAPVIRTAKDVFEYTIDMRNLTKEHLRGLYLNTHYQLVHDETISIGTIDANIVHPREVFRPALAYSAAAVILVHNHPSGNVAASMADREITRQLTDAGALLGIDLIDHVIVTADSFTSISTQE